MNIAIGNRIGASGGQSWSSYWKPSSYVVENVAPSNLIVTYAKKPNPADMIVGNFVVSGNTISSITADVTGLIYTFVLGTNLSYGDTPTLTTNSIVYNITNNVTRGQTINQRFELPLASMTNVGHMDTFINSLITGGVYSKLKAMYNWWIHDEEACRINWIADTEYLTTVNPQYGEPSFVFEQGLQGNGQPGEFALKMVSDLDDLVASNDWSIGTYIVQKAAGLTIHGAHNGSANQWILVYDAGANTGFYSNGSYAAAAGTTVPVMASASRDGDNVTAYKDGVASGIDSDAPLTIPAYPLFLLGRNNSGINEGSYGGIVSFFYLGSKLTEAEHKVISDAFTVWRNNFNV